LYPSPRSLVCPPPTFHPPSSAFTPPVCLCLPPSFHLLLSVMHSCPLVPVPPLARSCSSPLIHTCLTPPPSAHPRPRSPLPSAFVRSLVRAHPSSFALVYARSVAPNTPGAGAAIAAAPTGVARMCKPVCLLICARRCHPRCPHGPSHGICIKYMVSIHPVVILLTFKMRIIHLNMKNWLVFNT
jgi:hypothetical protein